MKTTLISLLVLVALVLAFLVGKNMRGDEDKGPKGPPVDQRAEEAVKKVFDEGAQDGKWEDEEDGKFLGALARLDRAGQLKHLTALADAVNAGKLKVISLKGTATPCCPTCMQCSQQQTPPPAGGVNVPAQPKSEGARAK